MSAGDQTAPERENPPGQPARPAPRLTVVSEEPETAAGTAPHATPRRGSLLAVCGLCDGAGTGALAYLVALYAARSGHGHVLVADTGGPSGEIACYTGVQAPRSLVELAEHVSAGLPAGQLVATTREGLRVLATGPRFAPGCARDAVGLLLDHARDRYPLTVIDCGTLAREADQIALQKASHVAWVLPASNAGVRRGERILAAIDPYLGASELLVARHDERERKPPLRQLKRLAEQRRATLILLPTLPDLTSGKARDALEVAQVSLQAIHGALSR